MMRLSRSLLCVCAILLVGSLVLADNDRRDPITWDVYIDNSTLVLVPPVPARGTTFVVNGTIYPGGSLSGGGEPTAAPIGRWVCRGTFLSSDPNVLSIQEFLFPDSGHSLALEGFELDVPVLRAVIGGTGNFVGVRGQAREERLGVNVTGGFNARFTFDLRRHGQ